MNEIVGGVLDWVQAIDPVLRTLVAGLAMFFETSILVGLIVPGDTIVIVSATGVASLWEGVFLVLAVIVGSLLGETLGFYLGRWLGPRIRTSWLGRKIGEKNWLRAERYLQRRGGPAILLSRFLPVLHSLVPLTVGMTRFSYRRFLLWTVPACTVWATLYVTVSALAAGTYRELADRVHGAGYIFVGIILVFLALIFVAKKILERNESRHLADQDADESDATER